MPFCQGGDDMSLKNLTPRTCSVRVEKHCYSYCQAHLLFFQKARPKCPVKGCDLHVKYSNPLGRDLPTCVDHIPKQGPQCPYCNGYCMINKQTGLPFKTCFYHRTLCPVCEKNFRGQSSTGYRYPTCSRCRYGEKYHGQNPPVAEDAMAEPPAAEAVMDPCFSELEKKPASVDPNEVD